MTYDLIEEPSVFSAMFNGLMEMGLGEDHVLREFIERPSRNAAARILEMAWGLGLISVETLQLHLSSVWVQADWPVRSPMRPERPSTQLTEDEWRDLFTAAGFTHNGIRCARPSRPVRLYRGATRADSKGWSWTTNREIAEKFAGWRGASGSVWTVVAPPEAILAVVEDYSEDEYVCDPALLPEPGRVS